MDPIDLTKVRLDTIKADTGYYRNHPDLADYFASGIDDETNGGESLFIAALPPEEFNAYCRGREWAAWISQKNRMRRHLGFAELDPHRA